MSIALLGGEQVNILEAFMASPAKPSTGEQHRTLGLANQLPLGVGLSHALQWDDDGFECSVYELGISRPGQQRLPRVHLRHAARRSHVPGRLSMFEKRSS